MKKMKKFFAMLFFSLLAVPGFAQNQLGPVTQVVAFTATPTFNASQANSFLMTLTGNVTSSTLTGGYAGEIVVFQLCQDATGGRTFAWPANILSGPALTAPPSGCNTFYGSFDGVSWHIQPAVSVFSTGPITPAASGAAVGVNTQAFTVSGVIGGDIVAVIKAPTPNALCPLVSARATAAGTVSLDWAVLTAAACTPTSGTYLIAVYR